MTVQQLNESPLSLTELMFMVNPDSPFSLMVEPSIRRGLQAKLKPSTEYIEVTVIG